MEAPFDRLLVVIPFPDLDLEIRGGGGGHLHPEIRGGTVFKTFFSALRASVWSKNKGGRSPLGPLP